MNVGRPEGERHQRVEPAVAGEGDRLAPRHDLSDLYERPRQVRRRGHQAAAVIDEDLQPTAVELAHDPDDFPVVRDRRRDPLVRQHRTRPERRDERQRGRGDGERSLHGSASSPW